ncbi:MAG TPA: hypothetical protein VG942_09200 [Hyphomonadaceae bacterium]|nr:hypothetical protein [Hyphomonadaceae bacterium]
MNITGILGVTMPFAMVVAIVWIVQNGRLRRAEIMSGRSRESDIVVTEMQKQIDKLTDRVAVLEKLVTDDDRRLAQEINRLRDTGRPST